MKKILIRILFYFIPLLFISQVAYANVLEIDFNIDENDVVSLNDMRMRSNVLPSIIPPGDYTIQILDSSGNILINKKLYVNFCVLSDPPICSDKTSVYFALDYSEDMKVFKLFHNGVKIFQNEINLCNSDSVCGSSESFLSCPQDCPLNKNDVICLPESDGICDPDCGEGVDPNCAQEFYPNAGEDKDVFFKEPVSFHGNPFS